MTIHSSWLQVFRASQTFLFSPTPVHQKICQLHLLDTCRSWQSSAPSLLLSWVKPGLPTRVVPRPACSHGSSLSSLWSLLSKIARVILLKYRWDYVFPVLSNFFVFSHPTLNESPHCYSDRVKPGFPWPFYLFPSVNFFITIHPLAYLTLTYWPHCYPLDRPAWVLMESFAPGNPHGALSTSSAVCSPIIFSSVLSCLKLHSHLTLPFPFPSFVVPFWTSHHLLSIYFIHLRLSKLISILGGKPHERKWFFPWVLGWGSLLFIVSFPALNSTLRHTHWWMVGEQWICSLTLAACTLKLEWCTED